MRQGKFRTHCAWLINGTANACARSHRIYGATSAWLTLHISTYAPLIITNLGSSALLVQIPRRGAVFRRLRDHNFLWKCARLVRVRYGHYRCCYIVTLGLADTVHCTVFFLQSACTVGAKQHVTVFASRTQAFLPLSRDWKV